MDKIYPKRIYEDVNDNDGVRVLVDRLWPRGVSKEKAQLNDWLKELGPSSQLRKEFHNGGLSYEGFKGRYINELSGGEQEKALDELKEIIQKNQRVTLLYAAKDKRYNNVQVLLELLNKD